MTKQTYTYIMMALLASVTPVWASGLPVYGHGEIVNMTSDQFKSKDVQELVELEKKMIDKFLKATGGPTTFSSESLAKELGDKLMAPSKAIGTYDGLMTILGPNSKYGVIPIKKCAGNAKEVIDRLNETVAMPPKEDDRTEMTMTKRKEVTAERARSIERSATAGLAKSWTIQAETADIAKTIGNTEEELKNAKSQMSVLATIARLQEETQKNLNTRLSIMGDDVITTGLMALDGNI